MKWKISVLTLILAVTLLVSLLFPNSVIQVCGASVISTPPPGNVYHAAYTPPKASAGDEHILTAASIRSYEKAAGKQAAWIYFSHEWSINRTFPMHTAKIIRKSGSVPYIRLMLRSSTSLDKPEPVFTLDGIIAGSFDRDLRRWAKAASRFDTPIIVEYGTEMNGNWFPWNAKWNGKEAGADRFRRAYRHIIKVMDNSGAHNLVWVFHLNGDDYPRVQWNRFEKYYPGDRYIDWIGISAYGPQTPMDTWVDQFSDTIDAAYPRIARMAPDKPIIIAEFGVCSHNPRVSQAGWAKAALRNLTENRWPKVIGFSWWNEWWENDNNPAHDTNMRIQDNPRLSSVFQEYVGKNPGVLGRPVIMPD